MPERRTHDDGSNGTRCDAGDLRAMYQQDGQFFLHQAGANVERWIVQRDKVVNQVELRLFKGT
jgi:hypothetical protein